MRIEPGGTARIGPQPVAHKAAGGPAGAPSFGDALAAAGERLTLSRHAQHRVERRGLQLDDQRLARLEGAVNSAARKGARNSVVMLDDLAVVVDIQQRMVVTAMEREGGRDRVFTNIDSVVIA
jgi:flagellar operon protein